MNYNIDYEQDGEIKTETFDAHDVGQAYRKCLKKHPEAKLVKGRLYREWLGGALWMDYDPVSTMSPEPLPRENRLQVEMELDDPRKPKTKRGRKGN